MLENGLTPSIAIYNTLLKAMFQRGQVCAFISLLITMVMEGCQTDEQTFEILNWARGWMKKYLEVTKLLGILPMRHF